MLAIQIVAAMNYDVHMSVSAIPLASGFSGDPGIFVWSSLMK